MPVRTDIAQHGLVATDRAWRGVNLRLDPDKLPEGYAAGAVNMRFTTGTPETRRGTALAVWANQITAGASQPWGTLHGLGKFNDPSSNTDWLIIAADGKIWRTTANNPPIEMPLPAGVTIAESVTFTQAGSRLICHRGFGADPLWLAHLRADWTAMPDPTPGAGTVGMPRAERSIYMNGRVYVPGPDDSVYVSDFNDPTNYAPVTQEFAVNPGSSDRLVTIAKAGKQALVFFKTRSIAVLYNAYGDLSAAIGDIVTSDFGCVSAESVVDVGGELWFLSQDGVRALVVPDDGQEGRVRLKKRTNDRGEEYYPTESEEIHPLIQRINGQYKSGASGAYWDRKFYLAVPLDNAEVLRFNRAPTGASFTMGGANVTIGKRYRYVQGPGAIALVNGTETLLRSGDFTAQLAYVYVSGSGTVDDEVREIVTGVNNAILVYDFQTGAWSGYDEAEGFSPQALRVFPVNRTDRLLVYGDPGVIMEYEAGFEDMRLYPYADVIAACGAVTGKKFSVNGGTEVTSNSAASTNGATSWGTGGTTAIGAGTLWVDGVGSGGYFRRWTSPGAVGVKLATGVRFYATNLVMPTISAEASTVTRTTYSYSQPIPAVLTTRAYADPTLGLLGGLHVRADVETWAATLDVDFVTGGARETFDVTTYTPDRTAWLRPDNRAAYVVDNNDDDGLDPFREDYSVLMTGTLALDLGTGLLFDQHQETRLDYRSASRADSTGSLRSPVEWRRGQVVFTCTTGRFRLLNLTLAAAAAGARGGITA